MKAIVLLLAVVAFASASPFVDNEWKEFKVKFGKHYSAEEDALRYKIFVENKALIAAHNKKFDAGEVTFKMGVNKFADMTTSDTSFLRGYKSPAVKPVGQIYKPKGVKVTAGTVDWRDQGYVTGVKDQGQCGSCWSFSASGSLEGQNFAKTGTLTSLSEQNLVDCDNLSFGCSGGYMVTAFAYVKNNGGIDTEASYPYQATDGHACRYDAANSGGTCAGHESIAEYSEDDLYDAVTNVGPISVAIDASKISFQLYTSGVYYEASCSETTLDHGVLAIGYGTEGGEDYWLVKNSWGTSWGEAGYIKMSRNRNNNCGIATEASYPLV
jgi:cathepsin L